MNVQIEKIQTRTISIPHHIYSVPQISTLQLAHLSKIYEGKIPVSILLARGSSPFTQIPSVPVMTLKDNQSLLIKQNATFTSSINNAPLIKAPILPTPASPIIVTSDNILSIGSKTPGQPGRPCFGSDFVSQREQVLKNITSYLKQHPHGIEVFNARKELIREEVYNVIFGLKDGIKPLVGKELDKNITSATNAWFKLNSLALSIPELNAKLKEAIKEIQSYTGSPLDHKNAFFLPEISDKKTIKHIENSIARFEKDAIKWLNNTREFEIECADQAERFLRHNQELFQYGLDWHRVHSHTEWNFLKSNNSVVDQEKFKKIVNHPFYSTFKQVETFLQAGQYEKAQALCSKIEKNGDYWKLSTLYKEKFFLHHTVEGIDKKFLNNPYYLAKKEDLQKVTTQDFPLPHELNSFLQQTESSYIHNKEALGITQSNQLIDEILYKLAETPSDTYSITSYINSYGLANDHSNLAKQQAYKAFYNQNGLLKIFHSEDNRLNQIPESIGHSRHEAERELLNNLAAHQITTPQEARLFSYTVDYLTYGLKTGSSDYIKLAHLTGNSILQEQTNACIQKLTNYATPMANVHHQQLQTAAVKFIAENLTTIHNADPNNPYIAECIDLIHRVDDSYRGLQQGDIQAEFYLEKAFTPAINTEVLKVDYDSQIAYFAGINQDQIVAHVQTQKNITEVLLKNGAQYELKQYQIPSSIKEFLISKGLDPRKFEQCYGHQVQQLIHLDILKQVVKQKDLSGLALINQSQLCKLRDLATKVTDLNRQHNTLGNIEQSGMLSSFCWQLMHHVETVGKYTIDTARGVGEGIAQGGQNFVHTITHPQEVIQGFVNLGKTALKAVQVHQHLNDISVLKPYAENLKLEAQFKDACRQAGFTELGEHLTDRLKNGAWKDNIRDITAIVVENALIGEVLPLARKTITEAGNLVEATGINTKALAERLAHDLKVPVTSVATTEGLEIKVAQSLEDLSFLKDKHELFSPSHVPKQIISSSDKISWTNHRFKHFPHKNLTWKQIIKDTRFGDAKYKPGINIEAVERFAWDNGVPTTNNKSWKVIEFEEVIGAKNGLETKYIRVECSANTIHGHPITFDEYKKYLK